MKTDHADSTKAAMATSNAARVVRTFPCAIWLALRASEFALAAKLFAERASPTASTADAPVPVD